jgi:hypothetical protein
MRGSLWEPVLHEGRISVRKEGFLAATLLGVVVALPALAASDACVQNNRIFSTKVIDSSTVLITDLDKKQYTVHMRGICVGLDKNAEMLSFRTQTQLGCLTSGDSISYNVPGENTPVTVRGSIQTPCFIDSVKDGSPPVVK